MIVWLIITFCGSCIYVAMQDRQADSKSCYTLTHIVSVVGHAQPMNLLL